MRVVAVLTSRFHFRSSPFRFPFFLSSTYSLHAADKHKNTQQSLACASEMKNRMIIIIQKNARTSFLVYHTALTGMQN